MFSGIVKKLRSTRGASLSMALMLMLVCLTVAGITLTAATAVAGRQNQVKKNDKSYYNVTSAAGLYWDVLRTNPIVRIEKSWNGSNGWTATIDGITAPLTSENASFFQIASFDLLFDSVVSTNSMTSGNRTITADAVKNTVVVDESGTPISKPLFETKEKKYYVNRAPSDPSSVSFKITPAGDVESSTDLRHYFEPVTVRVRRNEDLTYQLEFVENGNVEDKGDSDVACTITALATVNNGDWTKTGDVWTGVTTINWSCVSVTWGRFYDPSSSS